ncbi:MAG: dehydrogenase [Devosia sp.]|uniref:C-terminal binding protein n=1 Tax=Devosia sp. TaxID=1871048 RepID=UPI00261575D7|nr:C-terminal binding protein [Devosia sp.]MDB5536648.1 dehydrogenase [Devosia sp.]MDB5585313.1 dehydrogenase [Devosia sp.]
MASRFRILTPDAQYADDAEIERSTAGSDVSWDIFRERVDSKRVPDTVFAAADAIIVWHEVPVDIDLVRRIPNCRIIVRAGVGFDHIDLKATGEAGIPVANTPDYGTSEVADHAIALMLALCRGITTFHELLQIDPVLNFDSGRAPLVRRIRGRIFGIVGLGRIGIATAARAKAFGMHVIAYDPYAPAGMEIAAGVERVDDLASLLSRSDVVSLHCPLTDETRDMIDARALGLMKRDAVLINTARGAIVDIPALIAAVATRQIGGAGIDVLPVEPPLPGDAFALAYRDLAASNLKHRFIVTPHAAWSSPESRADARRLSVQTAMMYLRDGRLRNLVNGDYLRDRRKFA